MAPTPPGRAMTLQSLSGFGEAVRKSVFCGLHGACDMRSWSLSHIIVLPPPCGRVESVEHSSVAFWLYSTRVLRGVLVMAADESKTTSTNN